MIDRVDARPGIWAFSQGQEELPGAIGRKGAKILRMVLAARMRMSKNRCGFFKILNLLR